MPPLHLRQSFGSKATPATRSRTVHLAGFVVSVIAFLFKLDLLSTLMTQLDDVKSCDFLNLFCILVSRSRHSYEGVFCLLGLMSSHHYTVGYMDCMQLSAG